LGLSVEVPQVHGIEYRQSVARPSLIIERCFADVVAVIIVGVREVAVVVRPHYHRIGVRELQMIQILRFADIRNVR